MLKLETVMCDTITNSCRKAEPVGWDFEDIRFREDPIPRTWWFVPWSSTDYCEVDETSPSTGPSKQLLYYDMRHIEDHYRGSGLIVEETEGRVIGCYKVHADTDDGDDTKEEVSRLKARQQFNAGGLALVKRVDKPKSRKKTGLADARYQLTLGSKTYDGEPLPVPNQIRRLNGLILDARPARIAMHEKEVFRIHSDMAGCVFRNYGAQYPQLEYRTRKAMKDTFDKELDLPIYRQNQIEASENAGHPEVEFTDGESNSLERYEEDMAIRRKEIEKEEPLEDLVADLEEDMESDYEFEEE
jgi:hypothetical protein